MSSLYKPPARKQIYIYDKCLKRPIDVIISVAALAVTSVPMLLIAIVIKVTTRGPILFAHPRIGRNGKEFTLYKFRSMRVDTELTPSVELDPNNVTAIGRLLRRTSLDELPQFWNVLRGDMSVIGYRPVIRAEVWLNDARRSAGVFHTRPGITGLAQIHGRDLLSWRHKAEYDKVYARQITFLGDCKILALSFKVIIAPESARSSRHRYRNEDVSHENP